MQTKRLEGRDEPILEPDLPILDSHIHLFDLPGNRYMLEDYLADANAGHNIVGSIYCETQAFSRPDGPEHLRPLGEVEFANGVAAMCASGVYGSCKVAHGIIGHANLTLGSVVGELLDRCMEAAPDRFRGIRHVAVEPPDDRAYKYIMTFRPPRGVLETPGYPLGLAELEKRNLVFDAAVWHPTVPRLIELVDQFPNLTFVLNHMACAVGVDMSDTEKAELFTTWSTNLREIAKRPNVVCKTGGLGMPFWGFGFEEREDPVGSGELAAAWRPFLETAIEAFGADRCMMESNFPPDGRSGGFVPTWNAYKILTANASDDEKAALYHGTAARVYDLEI
ncbi:amidohydrolase family protein [Rhodobacterales bacterium HKCCE2091]|nr:amidohydrolase family protein [Rhodobacterales bacterium HKCCE2091]